MTLLTVTATVAAVVFMFAYIGSETHRRRLEREAASVDGALVRAHFKDQDAPSVEGILVNVTPDRYRLARAVQILSPDQSVSLDGEVWLDRRDLLLVQRLTG